MTNLLHKTYGLLALIASSTSVGCSGAAENVSPRQISSASTAQPPTETASIQIRRDQVRANGITIAYERFGEADRETVLLIMGNGAQLTAWPVELCEELVNRGYQVVIYDNRDVGLSTKFDEAGVPDVQAVIAARLAGKPSPLPYTLDDMAKDAVGLLDALKIQKAHIVGVSMGGMIAQLVAADHSDHALSLTSIMSTSGNPEIPFPAKPEAVAKMPPPAPEADEETSIANAIEMVRVMAGPVYPPDEKRIREIVTRSMKRSADRAGMARHNSVSALGLYEDRREKLKTIKVPTVVVHGTEDPLMSVEGGKDTALNIPGAQLRIIPGMGHDLPLPLVKTLAEAITVAASRAARDKPAESGVRASEKDWPMYNCDVLGTRHNRGETAISRDNARQLEEKWRFPARDSDLQIGVIHATPSVVNGYVYFGTATVSPTFYKLTPNGKVQWSYRNPAYPQGQSHTEPTAQSNANARFQSNAGGIFTSALVTEDAVFFGDMEGWFYALDQSTGKERWKLSTRSEAFPGAHPMNLFFASPILADGKLIVAGGTLEQVVAAFPGYKGCTGRGFVMALEPDSGRIVWKYDVGPKPEPLEPPITITDSWGDHVFYFGPATSSVWSTPSFDAESATIFFGTDVNTAPRRPTDDDPRLHTRESCSVIALDVRDGVEKWVTQINPGDVWTNAMRSYDPKEGRYKDQSIGDTPKVYTIPVAGMATKVVGVGCKNGGFYVLRAADGRMMDHTPIYTGAPTYPLSPEPDRRTLALPSAMGGLQTGCATDGETIFTNGIDALRLISQETLADSGLPTGGRVVALSLDTRTERWRHDRPLVPELGGPPPKPVFTDVGDPVASGVAVANGVVYFTTVASGRLVALDAASGAVLKEIDLGPVWSGPSVSRGRVYVGTGNTQFTPSDYEAFFPKKYTGFLYCFGLPGEDEVARLSASE